MSCKSLVIEARLLQGGFHGRGDTGEPEWPPSPARLFQALVAAAGDRRTGAEDAALQWLEHQPPPIIDAPERREGSPRRSYVPNNDADQHAGVASRILKVVQPIHLSADMPIRYIWSMPSGSPNTATPLLGLARRLRALGWGIDLAIAHAAVVDTPPQAEARAVRWLPQPNSTAGTELRVPCGGTLVGLDTDHRAAQARIQGGTQTLTGRSAPFRRIAYRTDRDLPPRPMRVFRLLDHGGASRSFWTIQTRELAAMLRHQAHQAAKTAEWNLQTVEGYVCGHGNNGQPPPINRLSYLPLPSIGHRHTDGLIRRIALAESPNGNGEHLHELANRLVGARLTREGDQRAMAVIAQPDVSDRVIQRYRRESTVWASVTPVVLPGFNGRGKTNQSILRITPDTGESELSGRDLKTHKLVLRCLAEAEIPAHLVAEVWLQKLPLWPNLPRAEKPPRPAYLRHRPTFHVRLRFKHAVHGPITLGAGRFTGLGTFAALREGDR